MLMLRASVFVPPFYIKKQAADGAQDKTNGAGPKTARVCHVRRANGTPDDPHPTNPESSHVAERKYLEGRVGTTDRISIRAAGERWSTTASRREKAAKISTFSRWATGRVYCGPRGMNVHPPRRIKYCFSFSVSPHVRTSIQPCPLPRSPPSAPQRRRHPPPTPA